MKTLIWVSTKELTRFLFKELTVEDYQNITKMTYRIFIDTVTDEYYISKSQIFFLTVFYYTYSSFMKLKAWNFKRRFPEELI